MKLRASLVMVLVAGACGSDAGPPDARVTDAPPPGGTFSMQWTLHDGTAPLACADVNALTVAVTIKPDNAGFGSNDVFSCTSMTGTTVPLAIGLYTLTVELDGASGALAAPQVFRHVEIKSQQDTPLGTLDFDVLARGGVKLSVAAQSSSSNCGAGGAGIEGTTLVLKNNAGTCVPATFMIAAGASTPASTYTSDCNSLPTGPCIEKDQQITVTGLRSGPVNVILDGLIGGKACWHGQYLLTVPAMDVVRDYGAQPIAYDNATCPRIDAM